MLKPGAKANQPNPRYDLMWMFFNLHRIGRATTWRVRPSQLHFRGFRWLWAASRRSLSSQQVLKSMPLANADLEPSSFLYIDQSAPPSLFLIPAEFKLPDKDRNLLELRVQAKLQKESWLPRALPARFRGGAA